jgi:hypothetical protein
MTSRPNPFAASLAAMRPGSTLENGSRRWSGAFAEETCRDAGPQINGCAFRIRHHTSDARKYGEIEKE